MLYYEHMSRVRVCLVPTISKLLDVLKWWILWDGSATLKEEISGYW